MSSREQQTAHGMEAAERYVERLSSAFGIVLLLVLATYVAASLTKYTGWSAVLVSILGCTTTTVALASSGIEGRLLSAAIGLASICVALAVVAAATERDGALGIAALLQILLLAWAAGSVLRAVLHEEKVGFRTILGAISVYLIFGLLFASLYVAIDRLQAGAFFDPVTELDTGDYVFFSFTTLTTTGYGNLVPGGQPGKMFSVLEMLLGQIFLVTLIAGLVSLWRPGRFVPRDD
jgi:Ion channel